MVTPLLWPVVAGLSDSSLAVMMLTMFKAWRNVREINANATQAWHVPTCQTQKLTRAQRLMITE